MSPIQKQFEKYWNENKDNIKRHYYDAYLVGRIDRNREIFEENSSL
jgi:hypothetical protein